MRRPAMLVVALLAALSASAVALSNGGSNAKLANQDRLYGGGSSGPGCFVPDIGFCLSGTRNFAVDAHSTSHGTAASGDLTFGAPGGHDQHAQITCLAVRGDKAVVGGIITQADRPALVGAWVAMLFQARGTPAFGERDLASPLYLQTPDPAQNPPGFPYVCPSPDAGAPAFGISPSYLPVTGGDIVVQDATSNSHENNDNDDREGTP